MNTKDINLQEDPLKILLVGENGSGKSIALASFFKAGPIRIWDHDGRLKPIKSYYPDASIDYDTFDIDNFRDFLNELDTLPKQCPFRTLGLDSVTTASTLSVVYQLSVKGTLKTTKGGLPSTSWDEINGETVLFTRMLELMKLLHKKFKVHIIWTAHPIPKTDTTTDPTTQITTSVKTTALASYGNKIPALIPGYFDEIYNFQKEKVGMSSYRHMVYTVPKNNLPGKTAFPGLLPESFDVTNKNFYEVLMSYLKPKP